VYVDHRYQLKKYIFLLEPISPHFKCKAIIDFTVIYFPFSSYTVIQNYMFCHDIGAEKNNGAAITSIPCSTTPFYFQLVGIRKALAIWRLAALFHESPGKKDVFFRSFQIALLNRWVIWNQRKEVFLLRFTFKNPKTVAMVLFFHLRF